MKTRWFLMAISCTLAAASLVSAQEESIGEATVIELEAKRYAKLSMDIGSTVSAGFATTVAPPKGKTFLITWMQLELTKAEDEVGDEVVSIENTSIKLTGADGKVYDNIGSCSKDGRFSEYGGGIYAYGDADELPFNAVFVVPEGQTDFQLSIDKNKHAVKVAGEIEAEIDPTKIAVFKVKKAEVVDSLDTEYELGSYDNPVGDVVITVESAAKNYLVLKMVIAGDAPNEGESFSVGPDDFGLVVDGGTYIPSIGAIEYGDFSPDAWGASETADAAGRFPAVSLELVFPLPEKAKEYQLLYLLKEIAKDKVPEKS